jgi:hypothetical protein
MSFKKTANAEVADIVSMQQSIQDAILRREVQRISGSVCPTLSIRPLHGKTAMKQMLHRIPA